MTLETYLFFFEVTEDAHIAKFKQDGAEYTWLDVYQILYN